MTETISVHNMFSSGLSLKFSFIELVTMNNLLSYYGLVDAKIRASDKDLPVTDIICQALRSSLFGILQMRIQGRK